MNLDQPKSLGNSIEVKASNRPIKVAYLVPHEETDINHMIIDINYIICILVYILVFIIMNTDNILIILIILLLYQYT